MDTNKIATLVRQLLVEIGEDPQREGLLKTPERVAAAYEFLTSGYRTDPEHLLNGAVFTQETNSMVIVKNIELYSLCEHHMLPFLVAATSVTCRPAACSASRSSHASSTCMPAGCSCRNGSPSRSRRR